MNRNLRRSVYYEETHSKKSDRRDGVKTEGAVADADRATASAAELGERTGRKASNGPSPDRR